MRTKNEGEAKPEPVRETMGMAEAASLLGVSVLTVRRMCKAHEKNHETGLAFAWTSPGTGRRDVNGNELRGHRRPFRDAVVKLARESGRLPESDPESDGDHS